MKLTKEQKKEYIKNGGLRCPFCRSENIDGIENNFDAGYLSQVVICNECHESWSDIYSLTDIIHDEDE